MEDGAVTQNDPRVDEEVEIPASEAAADVAAAQQEPEAGEVELPVAGELEEEFLRDQDAIAAEQELDPETLAALAAVRRSSADILASLQKQLYEFVPRHKWAIIRKLSRDESQTDTGLTIRAQQRSSRGEIVAVSEEIHDLAVGDIIAFSNFAMEVEDSEELCGEKDLFMVRDEEIYAKLRPKG